MIGEGVFCELLQHPAQDRFGSNQLDPVLTPVLFITGPTFTLGCLFFVPSFLISSLPVQELPHS
jgi:hypothetical protein